jgi:hypothetical protein
VFDLGITGTTPKPNGILIHGVAEDATGELYYLMESGQVIKLVPVPEPKTCALTIAYAAAISFFARWRRRI